jgi:hypothetical protein
MLVSYIELGSSSDLAVLSNGIRLDFHHVALCYFGGYAIRLWLWKRETGQQLIGI